VGLKWMFIKTGDTQEDTESNVARAAVKQNYKCHSKERYK